MARLFFFLVILLLLCSDTLGAKPRSKSKKHASKLGVARKIVGMLKSTLGKKPGKSGGGGGGGSGGGGGGGSKDGGSGSGGGGGGSSG